MSILRGMLMVVIVLAIGAGLFWSGVWAAYRYPGLAVWTDAPRLRAEAAGPPGAKDKDVEAEPSLDQLLQVARGQVRLLVQRQEDLERAERENRIAGNLLRAQSYADDSPMVREQTARKSQIANDLQKTREDLGEARKLEQSLVEARTQETGQANPALPDAKHRAAVRAFLLRRSLDQAPP